MKISSTFLLLSLVVWGIGCSTTPEASKSAEEVVEAPVLGIAPNNASLPALMQRSFDLHTQAVPVGKYLKYTLSLQFRGKERFRGEIVQSPSTSRISMQRAVDGATLNFDGTTVALLGEDLEWKSGRFDIFTWPYFFTAAMKLADGGTAWSAPSPYVWREEATATGAKLSFTSGTGDAPDDYYIVVPREDGLIDGMAYIVTFGKGAAAVENAEPHAITYADYRAIDGVPIAHAWSFFNWNEVDGLGEQLGSATVSDVKWVEASEEQFSTTGGQAFPAPQ